MFYHLWFFVCGVHWTSMVIMIMHPNDTYPPIVYFSTALLLGVTIPCANESMRHFKRSKTSRVWNFCFGPFEEENKVPLPEEVPFYYLWYTVYAVHLVSTTIMMFYPGDPRAPIVYFSSVTFLLMTYRWMDQGHIEMQSSPEKEPLPSPEKEPLLV